MSLISSDRSVPSFSSDDPVSSSSDSDADAAAATILFHAVSVVAVLFASQMFSAVANPISEI